MDNQKFLNIFKKSEINSKFILILIIISFIIIGGIFAYERWWAPKEISPTKSKLEERKIDTGTAEKENWGAMKTIEGKEVGE